MGVLEIAGSATTAGRGSVVASNENQPCGRVSELAQRESHARRTGRVSGVMGSGYMGDMYRMAPFEETRDAGVFPAPMYGRPGHGVRGVERVGQCWAGFFQMARLAK